MIKNRHLLLSSGHVAGRSVVLDVLEDALRSLDGYRLIRNLLRREDDCLRIGDLSWDLAPPRRVFVVGAGKAGNAMARAVDEVLGDRIARGLVIVKRIEPGDDLQHIELVQGGHPLPNRDGWLASRRILELVDGVAPGDLVVSVISGGSSALTACPVPPIDLEDEMLVTDQLLKSSARILEINAVRRHISATNGGRLAQRVEARGAQMLNLIISDIVNGELTTDPAIPAAFVGTPVAPDGTTLADARAALNKYDLLSRAPRSVVDWLAVDDPARETPKSFGPGVRQFVLARCADSSTAAVAAAARLGLPTLVLTTYLEGESRDAGTFLAAVAKEIAAHHRPVAPPCLLVAAGESTTRIDGPAGRGGPSQELALSFALEVAGWPGLVLAAVDTDGTDGPTDLAGALVDHHVVERAADRGLDLVDSLKRHDSSTALELLDATIQTGNTGTNVCDLNLVYVSG